VGGISPAGLCTIPKELHADIFSMARADLQTVSRILTLAHEDALIHFLHTKLIDVAGMTGRLL
jgi:hypothetical protein